MKSNRRGRKPAGKRQGGPTIQANKTDSPKHKGPSSPVDRGKAKKAPAMSANPSDRTSKPKTSLSKRVGKALKSGAKRVGGKGGVAGLAAAGTAFLAGSVLSGGTAKPGTRAKIRNKGKAPKRAVDSSKGFGGGSSKSSPAKPSSAPKKPASSAKKTPAKPASSSKKANSPRKLSAFQTAFATARKGGRKEFSFGGKRFTTQTKDDLKKKKEIVMADKKKPSKARTLGKNMAKIGHSLGGTKGAVKVANKLTKATKSKPTKGNKNASLGAVNEALRLSEKRKKALNKKKK